jgi:hypothetical protein
MQLEQDGLEMMGLVKIFLRAGNRRGNDRHIALLCAPNHPNTELDAGLSQEE